MKKFFFALAFVAASVALYANPVCYFTFGQARRTLNFLSAQDELVIYCGYEYELETYVIVSDVWIERVNSRYYEVWLYGIDAYTGEEIFMPVDLACLWMLDHWTNTMYNAAHYLHFHCDAPYTTLVWSMPVYHGFVRVAHPAHYTRSYHYNIHRHGWRPLPDAGLPPYYMRPPTAPMPVVVNSYVPGRERPTVQVNTTVPSRPAPTTTRTTSTPIRSSNPVPAAGNNRQPSTNNGAGSRPDITPSTHPTRTNSTSTRTTSTGNNTQTTVTPSAPTSRPTSTTTRTTTTTTPTRNTTATPSRATTTTNTNRTAVTSTPTRNITTPSRSTTATPTSSSKSTTTRTATSSQNRTTTTSSGSRPTSSSQRTGSTGRR